MVNRFLPTFGALAIFALLVSFGARNAAPASPVRLPAKAISEIPITHHFCQFLGSVGALNGSSGVPPLAGVMPADSGIAISEIVALGDANNPSTIVIKINGGVAFKANIRGDIGNGSIQINPPLIVPPAALLQFGIESGNPGGSNNYSMVGYTLEAAYFGS